jgi:hypothetical protein
MHEMFLREHWMADGPCPVCIQAVSDGLEVLSAAIVKVFLPVLEVLSKAFGRLYRCLVVLGLIREPRRWSAPAFVMRRRNRLTTRQQRA